MSAFFVHFDVEAVAVSFEDREVTERDLRGASGPRALGSAIVLCDDTNKDVVAHRVATAAAVTFDDFGMQSRPEFLKLKVKPESPKKLEWKKA